MEEEEEKKKKREEEEKNTTCQSTAQMNDFKWSFKLKCCGGMNRFKWLITLSRKKAVMHFNITLHCWGVYHLTGLFLSRFPATISYKHTSNFSHACHIPCPSQLSFELQILVLLNVSLASSESHDITSGISCSSYF